MRYSPYCVTTIYTFQEIKLVCFSITVFVLLISSPSYFFQSVTMDDVIRHQNEKDEVEALELIVEDIRHLFDQVNLISLIFFSKLIFLLLSRFLNTSI